MDDADPTKPTKVIPIYVKVSCLIKDYTDPIASATGPARQNDLSEGIDWEMINLQWKYDFYSTSPSYFVKSLQKTVDAKQNSAANENPDFNVQVVISLLVIDGHLGSKLGGGKSDLNAVLVQRICGGRLFSGFLQGKCRKSARSAPSAQRQRNREWIFE